MNPQPHCQISLDQARESRLLSPARMAEIESQIEARISVPRAPDGSLIETARIADLSPWPKMLYPWMQHDQDWTFLRREILAVVLTEEERGMLERDAHTATRRRKDAERYEKATKVAADQWDGWVTDGEHYAESVADYLDRFPDWEELRQEGLIEEESARSVPRFLWAAVPERVITRCEVDDVFESQMCDRGWDEMSADDLNGVAELQAALDAFVVAYRPDWTRAIILDPQSAIT